MLITNPLNVDIAITRELCLTLDVLLTALLCKLRLRHQKQVSQGLCEGSELSTTFFVQAYVSMHYFLVSECITELFLKSLGLFKCVNMVQSSVDCCHIGAGGVQNRTVAGENFSHQ